MIAGAAASCSTGTYLRTTSGVLITNAGNPQCIACAACPSGSIVYEPCTQSQQTLCGRCDSFQYGSGCVSTAPTGYTPVTVTVSLAQLKAITNNSVAFPLYDTAYNTVPAVFNVLPWTAPITLNYMAPCPALGAQSIYVPWTRQPSIITGNYGSAVVVTCTGNAMCKGYIGNGVGYYGNPPTCTACTTSAQQPTCGWGMFGNISACSPLHDSQCAQCIGAKPANAVWTVPLSPYYFDAKATTTCAWAGAGTSATSCATCRS